MIYMLDTNICIYAISNNHPNENVRKKIAEHVGKDICISSITFSELEYGVNRSSTPEKNWAALYQFLSAIPVLDYDTEAAKEYGDIRATLEKQGTVIGMMDYLIAAHARSKGFTIVTNNTKEFSRVYGLTVENWTI